MKISDSIETTSGLHVFETPEDLIINSQVYDKFSMEPKPYNFFNINTFANKNLLLHQINILEYEWVNPSKEPNYNYYIQDEQDSSIFYCLLEIGKADQNQYLHKIQKKNNKYTLLKSVSPDSNYVPNGYRMLTYFHYKIIGQTSKYILLTQEVRRGTMSQYIRGGAGGFFSGYGAPQEGPIRSSISYIVINKTDLSSRNINVPGDDMDNGVYFINKDNTGIYTLEFIGGIVYICYIDLNNASRKIMYTNNSYSGTGSIGISNVIKFQDFYYTIIGDGNDSIWGRKFLKFKIDEILRTCIDISIEEINNSPFTAFYANGIGTSNGGDSWIRYSLSNIDNEYIQITSHNNQNKQNGRQYISATYSGYQVTRYAYSTATSYTLAVDKKHRHFLCKKSNDHAYWEIINIITPANEQQFIYGVLYFNKYTPVFHLQTGVEIYKLDLETETYTKVFEAPGIFQTIGLDENNNFYTFDVNNKCQIYNLNSCSTLNGRFEYDTYNYDNEDIETNVTIASKNFIGELIASKIHVELSGNCKFRNGKQEATLNTRLDLEYEVPVIITGPGVVYCNINEVE